MYIQPSICRSVNSNGLPRIVRIVGPTAFLQSTNRHFFPFGRSSCAGRYFPASTKTVAALFRRHGPGSSGADEASGGRGRPGGDGDAAAGGGADGLVRSHVFATGAGAAAAAGDRGCGGDLAIGELRRAASQGVRRRHLRSLPLRPCARARTG